MSREIKFRAWDAEKGCWYEPTHEAYKGNLFELFVGFGGDLCAHTMRGMDHQSKWPDRFVLGQFAWAKDRDGNDIYENDIIEFLYPDDYKPVELAGTRCWVGVVQFDQIQCGLSVLADASNRAGAHWTNLSKSKWPQLRVIGNIHQNPDLLK